MDGFDHAVAVTVKLAMIKAISGLMVNFVGDILVHRLFVTLVQLCQYHEKVFSPIRKAVDLGSCLRRKRRKGSIQATPDCTTYRDIPPLDEGNTTMSESSRATGNLHEFYMKLGGFLSYYLLQDKQ